MLIYDNIKDLEEYAVAEPNLLTQHFGTAYENFLIKTNQAYEEYRENFPNSDVRPYQPEYAALMCLRRRNIMGYSMGCAKTSISLLAVQALFGDISVYRSGLVHIAVPSLLAAGRWIEELERMPALKGKYKVVTKESDLFTKSNKQILIYTHDFPKGRSATFKKTTRPYRSKLLKRFFKPCFLIIDEGHSLKPNSERTHHMAVLRDCSRRILLVSGTLSDGNLSQIHHLCQFVYKEHWPYKNAKSFSQVYGEKEKLKTNYLYGSQNQANAPEKYLQRLDTNKLSGYYKLMRRFVHRVKITEPQVARYLTIPNQEVTIHRLKATDEQKERTLAYIKLHKEKLQAASQSLSYKHQAEALQLIHPLIELANAPENVSNKAKRVLDITKKNDGKSIIFCSYVKSARDLTKFLGQHFEPGEVIRLYASDKQETPTSLNAEERQELVRSFQYDPKVKVAVLSINLASESIDLTKAKNVILYCMPWSTVKLTQALARAVRPGNTHGSVGIHYLLQEGLIDEHQVALSVEKVKGSKLLLDYETQIQAGGQDTDLTPGEAIRRLLKS
jgi:uncharacterized protein with PhoU and TrkA domain